MLKLGKRAVFLYILVFATTAGLFALGSREVPQIQVQNPSPWYLSPTGTSETAKHTASVTFTVKMAMKSKTGYIPEYSIAIDDANGSLVRDIVYKQKPDLGFFARLFSPRKNFTLQKTVIWNGKDNRGNGVADGSYTAKLTVVSQGGTKRVVSLGTFVIDTQPPQVSISAPDGLIFDPTGNGKRTALKIDQINGTVETLWTGTFSNSGDKAVRTYTWTNSAPKSFTWDGRDNSGKLLPDGHYVYRITSTDQAGNTSPHYQINDIVINTEKTPISLILNNPYFSPNGDGIKDNSTFGLSTKAKTPTVSWKVLVGNPTGTVVRSFEGEGQFPSHIVFDGKSVSGSVLPNATYTVTFDATFRNGNEEEATAPLVLNTTKPQPAVSYSNPAFSPNGDGIKDTTTAMLSLKSGEPVDEWALGVTNASGKVVRNEKGTGTPPSQVVFDGRNNAGNLLPDGTYGGTYQVTLADGMSNSTEKSFVVDTVRPKVSLSVGTKIFMPNGSGSDNTEVISYTSDKPVTWTGSLVNNQNRSLVTTQHPMTITKVVLNKSDPVVAKAPAGLYVLNLTFEDNAGNTYSPPPVDISLFSHPISTTVKVVHAGFSPLAPSGSNTITAALSTDTLSGLNGYTIKVVNVSGNVVAESTHEGSLPDYFTWNGTVGGQGSTSYPPEGEYRIRLTLRYTNGLTVTGESSPFFVDITPPRIAAKPLIEPFIVTANGDSLSGNIHIGLSITDSKTTISSWKAILVDPAGSVVKTADGTGPTKRQLSWSGIFPLSGPAPTVVSLLRYQLQVTATDVFGNGKTVTVGVPLEAVGQAKNGRIHILVPNLLFGPYKYALDSVSAGQGKVNERTLSQVAQVLKAFPSYRVEVDGYSMEIYKSNNKYYNAEENIIVPLSKNRADIARTALDQLGVPSSRIFARYWGGMNTLVDPHNVDLRWKNRRVEFILLPKGSAPAAELPALAQRFIAATAASTH